MNVAEVENMNTAKAYVKPAIEVIEMEIEGVMLNGSEQPTDTDFNSTGSDYTSGGIWGAQEDTQEESL